MVMFSSTLCCLEHVQIQGLDISNEDVNISGKKTTSTAFRPYLMSSSIFACASKSKGSAVRSLILSCSLLARSCCCSCSTLVKRSEDGYKDRQTIILTWSTHILLTVKESWHVMAVFVLFTQVSAEKGLSERWVSLLQEWKLMGIG